MPSRYHSTVAGLSPRHCWRTTCFGPRGGVAPISGAEGKPSCRERVFSVDWGIVFGATGMTVGLLSLVYARTQALHAQRQADAAQLATALELQRAMAERIYQARMDIVSNPEVAKEYLDSSPTLRELYGDHALEVAAIVRNAIDGLQDMYFLRKQGIVQDHQWQNWTSSFVPISRMPLTRLIYDNAVARGALDAQFAEFLLPVFDGETLADPKVS